MEISRTERYNRRRVCILVSATFRHGSPCSRRVAILYLYAVLKGPCAQCGRIRLGGSKYCDRCGKAFVKECPDCEYTIDVNADYCGNCGKKMKKYK